MRRCKRAQWHRHHGRPGGSLGDRWRQDPAFLWRNAILVAGNGKGKFGIEIAPGFNQPLRETSASSNQSFDDRRDTVTVSSARVVFSLHFAARSGAVFGLLTALGFARRAAGPRRRGACAVARAASRPPDASDSAEIRD